MTVNRNCCNTDHCNVLWCLDGNLKSVVTCQYFRPSNCGPNKTILESCPPERWGYLCSLCVTRHLSHIFCSPGLPVRNSPPGWGGAARTPRRSASGPAASGQSAPSFSIWHGGSGTTPAGRLEVRAQYTGARYVLEVTSRTIGIRK